VVILEDEELLMLVFRRTLEMDGYEAAEARTEGEVLEHCNNHGGTVKALVADLILPTCRGSNAALAATRIRPDLKVLFVSGTPVEGWTEKDVQAMAQLPPGSFTFLSKPFHPKVLLSKLDGLLTRNPESDPS
jgi:DNA-binding NtrC family response regulator